MNKDSITNDFLLRVQQYCENRALLTHGMRVLVAVSGGADSIALLNVLFALGYECEVAHCNFHLRGEESNRDMNFVESFATSLVGNEHLHIQHFDVKAYVQAHGGSIEMACRDLRYAWFHSLASQLACSVIAVGHNYDDTEETFFLNMLRGTGIRGLASIKPKNGLVVRPLLAMTRREILAYLDSINQSYIVDSSNLQNDYSRNKIRNIILPQIRELFPSQNLRRTIENMVSCNDFYQGKIDEVKREVLRDNILDLNLLRSRNESVSLILREVCREMSFSDQQMDSMLTASSGAVFFSESHRAVVSRQRIIFESLADLSNDEEFSFCLNDEQSLKTLPLKLEVEKLSYSKDFVFERNPKIAYFNEEILAANLTLRHWHEGDTIRPFGMKGKRLVSDIFSDAKLSVTEKGKVWLLEVKDEVKKELIWILNFRTGSRYKCRPNTPIIKITIE